MNHYHLTESVRQRVKSLLHSMGADGDTIEETVLIRDGHYCGRRFELDGNSAVWFVEENQIKCFTPDGALHTVVDAFSDVDSKAA
ncbi:MAG: hypothetical protein KDB14_19420 [Planctomycetales bacterium]|nr:hypothetical protein [Planctomycetales bacterium]